MTSEELLALFLAKIPAERPQHMFSFFAANAARGTLFPFAAALLRAIAKVEAVCVGYADDMITRMAGIAGEGEPQYEALLQILAEIYVTAGVVERADRVDGTPLFAREPRLSGEKNPEFEVCIQGTWCAIEVKCPSLIDHGRQRGEKPFQLDVRFEREHATALDATLPRDNPVKDFMVSANDKFAAYEHYRSGACRILIIVWDDFCNEPIAALTSPVSGLLTAQSFHRTGDDKPVQYPEVDAILIVRHQHQLIRSTRLEPLVDGVSDPFEYRHEGFPPKALITVPGGRGIPDAVLDALNAVPIESLIGAEYFPSETIMWTKF